MGFNGDCRNDENGEEESVGKGLFFFWGDFGFGEIGDVVVVVGEGVEVPEVVFAEDEGEVLEILAAKTVFERSSSHSHESVYIF